jgi:hypothetical protein
VCQLDRSSRPWENSYNSPAGPNDPVEDHPYLLMMTPMGDTWGAKNLPPDFKLESFESMFGPRDSTNKTAHALNLNGQ